MSRQWNGEESAVDLGVGSTVWVFDPDRRVYPSKVEKGNLWGGPPIWREHWRPCVIIGETSRSWLVGYSAGDPNPRKIGKRDLASGKVHGVLTTSQDLDAACYVNEHAYDIAERVKRLSGGRKAAEVLKQIALLIGYEEKPK